MIRWVAGAVLTALVVSTGVVAGPGPSPQQLLAAARESVLQQVHAAASQGRTSVPEEEQAQPEVLAEEALTPGQKLTLTAPDDDTSVVFSGHEVSEPLTVRLQQPAAEGRARRSVAAETEGTALTDVVEVVASTAQGQDVTRFPAELVERPDADAEHGPTVVDVIPGVALEFSVDDRRVEEAGVDPSTLRIFTREGAGEQWRELPSYFDASAGVVRGESDHLSQFVVIGTPFPVPAGPRVVLDPDNDEGSVSTPSPAGEFPYNWALVDGLRSMLEQRCHATVTVTRPAGVPFVSRATRAGVAANANPAATVGFGFNTWTGFAWGNASEGGTMGFSRGGGSDNALRDSFVANMPAYTGRPAKAAASTADFPFTEYAGLPGAYAHIETLFLDNNYDRPVIDNGFSSIINGAFRSLGGYLESAGFNCTNPVTGGWPSPPTQAELERWRHLGYQNYQTYGADPVSFSTGNLVESVPLFALPGRGDQEINATLVYNSQDGRLSRVGAGWSFGLGARAQRFSDGSVLAVRGDGASFAFTADGTGGYTGEAGTGLTLQEAGGGQLRLTSTDGQVWVFDAADIDGIGELSAYTDAHGQQLTFTYAAADPNTQQFVPLTGITDAAGQTVTVQADGLGRVSGFTLPDGRGWSLAYDAAGDLAAVTDANGGVRSFTYDDQHRMLTATDPEGVRYLVNEYDGAGRIVRQGDADNNVRTFTYDPGATTYVDNEGRPSVFRFDDHYRITGITNPEGETARWEFDARGNITSHTDEAGRTTSYTYDANDRLLTETDPAGATTAYTYTPQGWVASVTDAIGRTTGYTYDNRGLVTAVDQPDGTTLTYAYTAAGDRASATLPSGATTSYTYDALGNLLTSTDPIGRTTTYTYDGGNRLASIVDPAGGITSYRWDAGDRLTSTTDPVGGVTRFVYDRNGHLTSSTDPAGAVTGYRWDALSRVVSVTAADGGTTSYAYDREDTLTASTDPNGATTSFLLDQAYRTTGVIDPNGGTWSRTLDPTGLVTSSADPVEAATTYEFDAVGRTISVTDPTGVTQRASYDQVGRVSSTTDAAGGVTRYTYDPLDRVTATTDPAGFVTQFVYDIDGNLVGTIDRAGNPTSYTVDAAGQVLQTTDATGATTTYTYDPAGRVVTISDPDGGTTTLAYDPAGRTRSVTDPLGAVTAYQYDPRGSVLSVTDPLGAVTSTTYDPVGRTTSTTDPLGAVTRYAYDAAGNQTSVTDPLGIPTTYAYDPAAQLTQVTEGSAPSQTPGADTNVITAYTYTPAGLLATVTGPTGAVTSFAYDAAGRTVTESGPTGITTSTSYDSAGRVSTVGNGAGLVAGYTYDSRGDVATQTRTDGDVTFEYDPHQRPIVMSDPTGTTGWIYDKAGRLTEQTDSHGQKLAYTYTAAGLVDALTYPDGTRTSYTYDKAGRPTTQSTPQGNLGYTWDAAGRLTGITRPNQVSTTLTYDKAGRTTRILHTTPTPAATTPPASPAAVPLSTEVTGCAGVGTYLHNRSIPAAGDQHACVKTADYLHRRTTPAAASPMPAGASLAYGYAYNDAGNVTDTTRTITGPGTTTAGAAPAPAPDVLTKQFTYDRLQRLVSATQSTGQVNTYGYDPAGNRTTATLTGTPTGDSSLTAEFNAAGQTQRTVTTGGTDPGVTTYTYDAAGSRSRATSPTAATTFTHDPAGRLTATSTDGRDTTYAYDGLGRVVSTTDTTRYGSDTTTQTWDAYTPVATNSDQHGRTSLVRDPFGDVSYQSGPNGATWVLGDGRNTTATTNIAGQVTDLVDYDPFGATRYESTGWASFTGNDAQPGDPTLGIDQYYARTYDPTLGIWLSPDSWRGLLTAPQTLNRYAYVTNNPATLSDHLGYVPRFALVDGSSWTTVGAAKAATRATMLKTAVRNGLIGTPTPRAASPSLRSAERTAATHSLCSRDFYLSQSTCSFPNGVTYPSRTTRASAPTTAQAINCATDVKVGMASTQMAANDACGRALAEASIRTQPQWLQDLYHANQRFYDAAQPAVVIIAIGAGIGAGRASAAEARSVEGALGTPLKPTTAAAVREELQNLPRGKQSTVRLVADEAQLRNLFDRITQGATRDATGGYPGESFTLSDGTSVRLRSYSSSGGATIDIRYPGSSQRVKVHIQ
ncbi:RHS repeat-associated core domain-containing protein [uncultured Microbacterium sp.]|uniref:RHS repeat-associated core domain-containing protein n=1 Tax=uncultured Microbacterium sp. TaxID=191216 RepID=UPI0025F97872|nr:RHS repeat-associated core domain-containing protein [uncultured Microbacterium sp.]